MDSLSIYAVRLQQTLNVLTDTTAVLTTCPDLNLSLSNATTYLDAMGHVVIAWMWLKQARVAAAKLENANGPAKAFYDGKLRACHFFFSYELPLAVSQFSVLAKLDDCLLTMPEEAFTGQ